MLKHNGHRSIGGQSEVNNLTLDALEHIVRDQHIHLSIGSHREVFHLCIVNSSLWFKRNLLFKIDISRSMVDNMAQCLVALRCFEIIQNDLNNLRLVGE